MTRYVLVPGMCHGAWWYDELAGRLREGGHEVVAVTPTGLEQEPDLDRRVTLTTHVADVVAAVDALAAGSGEARDLVLVGHSYGGLLVTAAADVRAPLVRALVYLDAFVPEDGDCAHSLTDDAQRAWYVQDAGRLGDAVDPLPFFDPRARPHPVGTLLQRVELTGAWRTVPSKVYAEAAQWPDGATPMRTSIDRVLADPEFRHERWDTRHNVMHDGPDRVLGLLSGL